MADRCCPWWLAYFFDNPLRRLFHKPEQMFADYVKPGMTVLDLGCGMGYFSIALAKMVGEKGRVISVDIQPQMLAIMEKRARKAGVFDRIRPVLSDEMGLRVRANVDFALAAWMVHEVKGLENFLRQVRDTLKTGGIFYVIEPSRHVSLKKFSEEISEIERAGFEKTASPRVYLSNAAVFIKK
jgi:ubiquinone/menaquinone biosynthesis C-methylase UbiE